MTWRALLKGILLIVGLVLAAYLLQHASLIAGLDANWIDQHIRRHGLTGVLVFVAVGALVTGLGLPRQLIAFLGGYGFGWWWGTLFSTLAAGFGCLLSFYYARLLARDFIRNRAPRKVDRLQQVLARSPLQMTLLIRLLPVGSNLATNLVAGVCAVPAGAFVGGSLLGYLPQMLVFSLSGSGVTLGSGWQLGLSILLFVASSMLGLLLFRQLRLGRQLELELSGTGGLTEPPYEPSPRNCTNHDADPDA